MKVHGARPFMGFVYEVLRIVTRWLAPPCMHCAELGHNCYVCAERATQRQGAAKESE